MTRIIATLALAGLVLSSTGCCWPMRGRRWDRDGYGERTRGEDRGDRRAERPAQAGGGWR
jgi:hypothetical protein